MYLSIPSDCGLGVAMGAAREGSNEAASMNRFHPGLRCMPNHPLVCVLVIQATEQGSWTQTQFPQVLGITSSQANIWFYGDRGPHSGA